MLYQEEQPYGTTLYKDVVQVTEGDTYDTYENGLIRDGSAHSCNKLNSITGRMLRFALKGDQGQGWCLYNNEQFMVWPEIKPIDCVLENDQVIKLAIDEADGQIYEIQTRDGPIGSGLVRTFRDKESDYAGHEIPTEIRLREHVANEEHEILMHNEGHYYLRPHDESMKGTTGHTLTGYRNAFEVDISKFADGEINDQMGITKDIPITGDIVFDKSVEARRLQTKIYTTTSSYKLVKTNEYYEIKDKRGSPEERAMSEDAWQAELEDPVLWITRDNDLTLDQVSQVACTGSLFGSVTGPDLYDDSAMSFSPTTGLSHDISNLDADCSLMFSVAGLIGTTDIFTISTVTVRITKTGTAYSLDVVTPIGTYSTPLTWTGSGWVSLKIDRDGTDLTFCENGVQLARIPIPVVGAYTGPIGIMTGQIGNLFDVRLYTHTVSQKAFDYYYYNLTHQNGDAVMPMF